MADLFISYAREDSQRVDQLVAALEERDREVWIDREGIQPAEPWSPAAREAMERSDAIAFMLSPASLASKPCRQELDYAVELNKRIIVVCLEEPAEEAERPQAVTDLSWIMLRPQDPLDAAVDTLIQALDTDLEVVRMHTRITVRAKAWDVAGRRASPLLRGDELRAALDWLSRAAVAGAPPTDLQEAFILASRQAATRRTRLTVSGSLIVAAISLGLAAFALVQLFAAIRARDRATAETRDALSRELAATSLATFSSNPDESLLLSLESYREARTDGATSAVLTAEENANRWIATLRGHAEAVRSVAFGPDDSLLASGADDGTIRFWSPTSFQELGTSLQLGYSKLVAATAQVFGLAFSPDGRTLLSGDSAGHVDLWDVATRKLIWQRTVNAEIESAAYDPSGRAIAVGTDDCRVVIWDLASPEPRATTLKVCTEDAQDLTLVTSVAYSADGRLLAAAAAGGTDPEVRVWRADDLRGSGRRLGAVQSGDSADAVAFGAGHTVAVLNENGATQLWDAALLRPLTPPVPSSHGVARSMTYSATGLLAVGYDNGVVQVWDRGRALTTFIGTTATIYGLAFAHDGARLAAASDDSTIELWDTSNPDVADVSFARALDAGTVYNAAFGPGGDRLVVGGPSEVSFWNPDTGQETPPTINYARPVDFALSPSADVIAVAGGRRLEQIQRFELPSGRALGLPLRLSQEIVAMAISPNGSTLAVGEDNNQVRFWNLNSFAPTGRPLIEPSHDSDGVPVSPKDLAYSPDGRLLVVGYTDDSDRLWRTSNEREIGSIARYQGGGTIALSPGGQMLATGSFEGNIQLWTIDPPKALGVPLEPPDATLSNGIAESVDFSPDGQTLVASVNQSVYLWDVASHQPLGQPLQVTTGGNFVEGAVFNPAGTTIAAWSSGQNHILLYDRLLWPGTDDAAVRGRLCQAANRNLTRAEWSSVAPEEPYHRTCA